MVDAVLRAREQRLARQHVDDGLLERRRDVGHRHRLAARLARLDPPSDRGLQAAEGEVEAVPFHVAPRGESAREVDDDLAVTRRAVDVRPARERQPEHPRDLVERLARGVVDRRAERSYVVGHVRHEEQRRVAARHEQRHRRLGQRPVLQLVDAHVGGEVVDPVDRLVQRERERLGGRDADEQRAREPRARRHGERVDVRQRDSGVGARTADRGHHRLEVRTARHLGHHAAEPRVLLHAAGDRVGEQGRAPDDADPRLVARGLDAEHQRLVAHHAGTSASRNRRRITRASAPGP